MLNRPLGVLSLSILSNVVGLIPISRATVRTCMFPHRVRGFDGKLSIFIFSRPEQVSFTQLRLPF